MAIAGALTAGDATAAVSPSFSAFYGLSAFNDSLGNNADGDEILRVNQAVALQVGDSGRQAAHVVRSGDITHADYIRPTMTVEDDSASAQPVASFEKNGSIVLELSTRKSITGALASVTDANAKAVLTSVIAVLASIKVADNNTT